MKATTMCRWCGGEMVIDRSPNGVWYDWHCLKCGLESSWDTEAEALAWAEQPIPWMPKPKNDDWGFQSAAEGAKNSLINNITAALAVKTEEE